MANRKLASIALAGAIVLGATGCTFVNPVASMKVYSPSEGSQIDIETVKVRNLAYVTDGAAKGALVGAFVNSGMSAANVSIQYTDAETGEKKVAELELPAAKKVALGTQYAAPLQLKLAGIPGSLVTVYISENGGTGREVRIPVLDGTLAEYKSILDAIPGETAPVETAEPVVHEEGTH
ncbi:MAG: hypothetical protein RIR16_201 [Actinomycetota bacterium]